LLYHLQRASAFASQHFITDGEIDLMHQELGAFCDEFSQLYGPKALNPTHHYLLHMKEIMLAHGPGHVFWLFPWERYNSVVVSLPFGTTRPELSMMRAYTSEQQSLERLLSLVASRKNSDPELVEVVSQLLGNEVPSAHSNNKLTSNSLPSLSLGDATAAFRNCSLRPVHPRAWHEVKGDEWWPGGLRQAKTQLLSGVYCF
jgi:hypothetical protein